MELGQSGRPLMTNDDDVGFAWSGRRRASAASYRVDLRNTPIATALTWRKPPPCARSKI